MNKYTFKSPEETKEFASQLAKKVPDGKIIALIGNLGTGKTTLAKIIAKQSDMNFRALSAVSSGLSDIRKISDEVIFQRSIKILII